MAGMVTRTSGPGIDLGSVQKTLLLPLWGRAIESRKPKPLLIDETAVKIVDAIGYDFSTIAHNIGRITQLAWVVRCLHGDRIIREFLQNHPGGTIVNLGCGLDTTLERIDNGRLRWYDLDLPDVIELKQRFVPENRRRNVIACSLLDERWMSEVKTGGATLLIAMGVFYYLREPEMRKLLVGLANSFPCCEVYFDACSAFGLKVANKKVIQEGGMDDSAILRWSLGNAKQLETWDPRLEILAAYPMFHGARRGLSMKEKWGTLLSDRLRVMSMIHLRLGGARAE
jgi:O-methyltransferase involved in polyketide biosynthesis